MGSQVRRGAWLLSSKVLGAGSDTDIVSDRLPIVVRRDAPINDASGFDQQWLNRRFGQWWGSKILAFIRPMWEVISSNRFPFLHACLFAHSKCEPTHGPPC